jgi:hypothetical protein
MDLLASNIGLVQDYKRAIEQLLFHYIWTSPISPGLLFIEIATRFQKSFFCANLMLSCVLLNDLYMI